MTAVGDEKENPTYSKYADEESTIGVVRPPSVGGAILRVIGEGMFASHTLPAEGQIVIGRSATADLRIDHPSLSRKHAVLYTGASMMIEDLGSANGTRVGARELAVGETCPIGMHQVFEVGTVMLVVQPDGSERRPAALDRMQQLPMQELGRVAERIAVGTISVLLLGETGVGKEVMAERLHRLSPRASKPFLRINCGAMPEQLFESELFGHAKGAFTGAVQRKVGLLESARGGTVFLDEVGELPAGIQVKLLRVLESREVHPVGELKPRPIDVRFIAATNRNLQSAAQSGAFRQDLYFRLNGISLTIPPLRDRMAELDELTRGFLADSGRVLSADAMAALRGYAWPGNVRELRNVIERAVLLCPGAVIEVVQLGLPVTPESQPERPASDERQRIVDALMESAGNQKLAAERLGISRGTLVSRLDEYGIPRPRKSGR